MKTPMAVVTLYTQPGCRLCDDARDALLRVRRLRPFELVEADVQDDPALLAEYGEQIPVVLLNGTFVFEYAVDEGRLRELLAHVA